MRTEATVFEKGIGGYGGDEEIEFFNSVLSPDPLRIPRSPFGKG
jgi:hypothetical protein